LSEFFSAGRILEAAAKETVHGMTIAAEEVGKGFGVTQAEDKQEPFIGHSREGGGVAKGLIEFDFRHAHGTLGN